MFANAITKTLKSTYPTIVILATLLSFGMGSVLAGGSRLGQGPPVEPQTPLAVISTYVAADRIGFGGQYQTYAEARPSRW